MAVLCFFHFHSERQSLRLDIQWALSKNCDMRMKNFGEIVSTSLSGWVPSYSYPQAGVRVSYTWHGL
jgi:hypothetical protein